MKKRKLSFIFFIILIFSFSWSFQDFRTHRERELQKPESKERTTHIKLYNQGQPFRYQGPLYAPDQILVKFKPSISEQKIQATIAAYKSKKLRRIPRVNIYQVGIPEGVEVMEMVYVMSQNPDIEYVEPNYIAHITVTPNDPFFKYQYALYNSGQDVGVPGSPQGKNRADIKATGAWEETKGDEEVIIAVLDTGVDLLHPDLAEKIHNSGRDFVNDDFDATDDHSHGTFVAGIAAAETNNQKGIAGVAWNCKILPLKVMDVEGEGLYSWIIDAIVWAADNGAHVINLSLGGEIGIQALEEAVRYAYMKDIVIVAAAGNDGDPVLYPAAYDDYCLAVAATDNRDIRPSWSNFGPEVDVAAPGVGIASTVPTWYWDPGALPYGAGGDGTSFATPHVAGLAALIKSIKPWLEPDDIMDIIRYSADDTNSSQHPGKDELIGHGRLNMEKALVPIKIESSK